jgi:hypothetical protein
MTDLPTEDQLKAEQDEVLREYREDPQRLAHEIVVLRRKLIAARARLAEEGVPIP